MEKIFIFLYDVTESGERVIGAARDKERSISRKMVIFAWHRSWIVLPNYTHKTWPFYFSGYRKCKILLLYLEFNVGKFWRCLATYKHRELLWIFIFHYELIRIDRFIVEFCKPFWCCDVLLWDFFLGLNRRIMMKFPR